MITIITDDGRIIEFNYAEDATKFLMRMNERIENKIAFVEQYLNINGSISRNFALGKFISRLSAEIHTLKGKGYKINGGWDDEHKDYIYKLVKRPKGKGLL